MSDIHINDWRIITLVLINVNNNNYDNRILE